MRNSDPVLQQHDAAALAQGYSSGVRTLEIVSILSYFALLGALGWKLGPHALRSPWLLLAALTSGYLAADFVSGLVHWLADTWGDLDMPVVGKFLRPFREHHVDQKAITRHDFIETNGNNCFVSVPALAAALLLRQGQGHTLNLFIGMFIASMLFWVMTTNQFHKWAHLDESRGVIALLQRLHLILPPEHHAQHHAAPFNRSYCITVGWLNYPLGWMRFFPALEAAITALTGALPRRDDIGERAALQVSPVVPEDEVARRQTASFSE